MDNTNQPMGLMDYEFSTGRAPELDKPDTDTQPEQTKREYHFRREIDLGDGSGVQVFEGKTLEELTDKLVEAQRNATIKIREQNRKLKTRVFVTPDKTTRDPVPQYNPVNLTPEQVFMLQREMESDPVGAMRKIAEYSLGAPVDRVRENMNFVEQLKRQQVEVAAANEFVRAHASDYVPCDENQQLIQQLLDSRGYPITRQNLEWAYNELTQQDVLLTPEDLKEQEKPPVKQTATTSRIDQSQPPVQQKPVMTGLSDSMNVQYEPAPARKSDQQLAEEIASLPYEQARQRIADEMYRASQRRPTQ